MRIIRELIIIVISIVALLYLFAPSLLPDLVPFIGWLDEGIATTVVLSALRYYGLDLSGLFGSNLVQANRRQQAAPATDAAPQMQTIRIPRAALEQALREADQRQMG